MPSEASNNRDDFTSNAKRIIAQRSGFRCAICGCQTEGPGLDPDKAVSIGDAAHITAAAPRGPRYDANLTSDQRTHADNGLWACKNHHWTIDRDEKRYTVADLISRKRRAENLALRLQGLETAHGAEIAAAILATRDASERMIAQWREKYRYNQTGIIDLDLREKLTEEGPGAEWTLAQVTAAVAQGHKLLLAGRPGAGKTITLIQVAEQLAAKADGPVPLIFSVSGWIAANRDLASHVGALLTSHGVATDAASLLLATGRVAILLNGWNETAEAEQARASELLNEFLLSYSLPGVILSTRATRHSPSLVGETVLELLPLTALKRESVIRAANLPDPEVLLRQIAQSRILAEVTETPLFLGAAIKLARAGRPIPNSRAGLLESFLANLQDTDNHAARLHALPCQDCHYRYQTDLAVEMTRVGITAIPKDRAMEIIGVRRYMHLIDSLLGLHVNPSELTIGHMSLRAFVVFLWGILIVRCGDRRLLGKNAGFDMLLLVILGSVLSRGINGQAAFFPTLGVSAVLVFLHHLLALATFHSDSLSRLVKGTPRTLVKDGEPDREEMRRTKFTRDDLDENLRINGNVLDLKKVGEARLERNGSVSVVQAEK